MAYLRELARHACAEAACSKKAEVELMNRYNALVGRYCRAHGTRKLADMQRSEQNVPALEKRLRASAKKDGS